MRMYAIADKYFIAPLKKLAAKKFEDRMQDDWTEDKFANAIAEIYDTAPANDQTLKNIAIKIVNDNANTLADPEEYGRYEHFREVLRTYPAFAADAWRALAICKSSESEEPNQKWYTRPKCGTVFCIVRSTPGHQYFDCPRGCYRARSYDEAWWEEYSFEP